MSRFRIHKSHEPIYGTRARHAKQDTSMLLSDMPNTRFEKNLPRLFSDPQYSKKAQDYARRAIEKSGALRRERLNEVSYKCSGRTGYGDKDRL
jgi:hypothetical protein